MRTDSNGRARYPAEYDYVSAEKNQAVSDGAVLNKVPSRLRVPDEKYTAKELEETNEVNVPVMRLLVPPSSATPVTGSS